MKVTTASESWTETSAAAAAVSQDGEPLSLPGVIDPGLDFVIGLAVAISSGIWTPTQAKSLVHRLSPVLACNFDFSEFVRRILRGLVETS